MLFSFYDDMKIKENCDKTISFRLIDNIYFAFASNWTEAFYLNLIQAVY